MWLLSVQIVSPARNETVSPARRIVTFCPCRDRRMHLHAARLGIEPGDMLKLPQNEVGVQLPIDARQQVQIEPRRHAQRVVIGRQQLRYRFLQIGAQ